MGSKLRKSLLAAQIHKRREAAKTLLASRTRTHKVRRTSKSGKKARQSASVTCPQEAADAHQAAHQADVRERSNSLMPHTDDVDVCAAAKAIEGAGTDNLGQDGRGEGGPKPAEGTQHSQTATPDEYKNPKIRGDLLRVQTNAVEIPHTGKTLFVPMAPKLMREQNKRIITLPNNWQPRPHQLPLFQALDSGTKRAVAVWHRRAGKDSAAINYTAKCTPQDIGTYWHVLPTQRQARKVVWQGIDRYGRRIIDQAFPQELRKRTLEDEMMIEFNSGSVWQLVGGDNYDALVGSNPRGIVFSEFSLTNPLAWNYVRPILVENGGWAVFIYTPRGLNHGHEMYTQALKNPEWFCERLTIADTGLITQEQIEAERQAGMPEAMIQQEFYCSFEANNVGAIFGREMEQVARSGRLTSVPYDSAYPVETAWDLGFNDATVIWFIQRIRNEIRLIDYLTGTGKALPYYCGEVNNRPYAYSRHIAPHDARQTEYGSGLSRVQIAENHGIRFTIAPKLSVEDGIEATRSLIGQMTFDAAKCDHGILALRAYEREWDEEKKILTQRPKHDWTSHPCDALRTFAVTPRYDAMMPDWYLQELQQQKQQRGRMGHNGGPPLDDIYDPHAAMR